MGTRRRRSVPPVLLRRTVAGALVLGRAIANAADPTDETQPEQVLITEGRYAQSATRTLEPILDIPRNVQVVPHQVIEDRALDDPLEAIQNVSAVMREGSVLGEGEAHRAPPRCAVHRGRRRRWTIGATLARFRECSRTPGQGGKSLRGIARTYVSAATVLALASGPSLGQTHDDEISGPEEVVVTAQKRPERLLDVPMSISVLTGGDLTREGATTLKDIASEVPGLSTVEFTPGQARTQLRGVSSIIGSSTIGTYLDEIPINVDSVQLGADVRFIDLDRIEVLRGPQGSLYGEGSMGGTIKYVTRNPDLRNLSVDADSAVGTSTDGSNLYRADGVLNVPIVDNSLAIRLAGGYERTPGWISYPLIGASDVNKAASKSGRAKMLWQATDVLKVTLQYAYQDSNNDSQNFANKQRTAPYVALQPYEDMNRLSNVLVEFDAGDFTVLSSTSHMYRDIGVTDDVTGFFSPIYYAPPPTGFGVPPGTIKSVLLLTPETFKANSEELRFASKPGASINWTTGLYYRDYRESDDLQSATTPNPLPVQLLQSVTQHRSRQAAAFGDGQYEFTGHWSATLGLRYFRDERDKSGSGATFGAPTLEPTAHKTFTSVDPRAVISYHPSRDTLFYGSAAKGFRSGGFNLVASRPPGCKLPDAYDPEVLWTYEIGSKLGFFGDRLTAQVAGYHNHWNNIQVAEFCPGGQITQTTNVGKASGNGIDLQVSASALDSLRISLSGGYNDSEYHDTSASHIAGDRIDLVPMWTGAAAADLSFRGPGGYLGVLHLDYQYEDKYSIAVRNFGGGSPLVHSDSWGRLNGRVSLSSGKWEVALFATNITDTNRVVFPATGVLLVPVSMQPRTYGVGVRHSD
jgi:iron complex outermembrane receptor protein